MNLQEYKDTRTVHGTIGSLCHCLNNIGVAEEICPILVNDLAEQIGNLRALELTESEVLHGYLTGFEEGFKDLQAIHKEHNL